MSLYVTQLSHTYETAGLEQRTVLKQIDRWQVAAGEQVLLRGISGSGKTTLLNVIAGLLQPTAGTVRVAGQSLYDLDEAKRDVFRSQHIGYVLQTHHLLPMLTALENVLLPMILVGTHSEQAQTQRARQLLEQVGLAEFADHRPNQLSTGQRQRVAIARALANNPTLLLADEPTASLDASNKRTVIELLKVACQQNNAALIVSSHDPTLTDQFGRVVNLESGVLHEDKVDIGSPSEREPTSQAQRLANNLSPSRILYDLLLAWRSMRNQPVQSFITTLVVGLAIALFVSVTVLNDGVREGIIEASDPFGTLVIGAKGSAQQLVLNTILLQGLPVGNIPIEIYERLQADERVSLAVPIAMGDNVGGARIIGTSVDFFTLRPTNNEPPTFQIAQGRLFDVDSAFEAVLGSTTAAALGLGIGDKFVPAHGVERGLESDVHERAVHTVVGILQPTNSPYDNAVFTTVETVWAVHAEQAEFLSEFAISGEYGAAGQVTAILLKTEGYSDLYRIWQEFQVSTEAQAAFPGQELGGLFDLLAQGREVLTIVAYLAAGMASLTVLLAIYSATVAKEQLIAIIRTLGANRFSIFRMVMFEALVVTVLGSFAGRLLGYGVAGVVAFNLSQQSAIPIPIRFMTEIEPWLWGVALTVGLLAGVTPAIMAYRVNVVEKLFPA